MPCRNAKSSLSWAHDLCQRVRDQRGESQHANGHHHITKFNHKKMHPVFQMVVQDGKPNVNYKML